jgi:hypothetical protein
MVFFLAMNGLLLAAAGLIIGLMGDNGVGGLRAGSADRLVAEAALFSARTAERQRPLGADALLPVIRMQVASLGHGSCRANLPPSPHDERTVKVHALTLFGLPIREYRVTCAGRSAAEARAG